MSRFNVLNDLIKKNATVFVTVSGKYNDDGAEFDGYKIGFGAFDPAKDDGVFYWCDSVSDFESLFIPGFNDFTLMDFSFQ